MKYKIAYYIRTDIQHIPPVINIYNHLGGIIITKTKEIFDFVKSEYDSEITIIKVKNSFEARKICWKNDIKIVIYTGYQMINWGYGIQIFHGISDKKYDENKKIFQYDLLLLSGQKQYDKIKDAGFLKYPDKFKMVGYPKLDKIINSSLEYKPVFNNNNKTILYAPTWISENSGINIKFSKYGESSLPLWGKKIIEAVSNSRNLNLIIKYHSRINNKDSGIYKEIEDFIRELDGEKKIKVVWDADITPYMKEADLMISDISAVCYEWFHLDKPIIFANPAPKHYIASTDKNATTSAWIAGEVINKQEDIIPLINISLNKDRKKEIRKKILEYSFYKPDGKATKRQVDEIRKYYNLVKNRSKIKILRHNFLNLFKIR